MALVIVFGVLGIIMGFQLSDRNSDRGRQKIVKSIAEIKAKLNP